MRKNIVAGNWKMNKTLQEGVALAKELNEVLASKTPKCDVVIGTPFIHLATVAATVDTKKIGVAAQNCANKESGAYTGEVSAAMSQIFFVDPYPHAGCYLRMTFTHPV